MSDFSLCLGPVAFTGFELPSSITFGGRQRLAIHKLPGGIRVIDALGPDPSDIAFSGIFSGPDAADRARLLDTLRIAGTALPLTWNAFSYTVILDHFAADFRSPWWIPYRLSCAVVQDETASLVTAATTLLSSVTDDLSAAGPTATAAATACVATGATQYGSAANLSACAALVGTLSSFDGQLATATAGLGAADPVAVSHSAGNLAQLTTARAYAARAARNMASA